MVTPLTTNLRSVLWQVNGGTPIDFERDAEPNADRDAFMGIMLAHRHALLGGQATERLRALIRAFLARPLRAQRAAFARAHDAALARAGARPCTAGCRGGLRPACALFADALESLDVGAVYPLASVHMTHGRVEHFTEALQACLEDIIRDYFGHWLLMHRAGHMGAAHAPDTLTLAIGLAPSFDYVTPVRVTDAGTGVDFAADELSPPHQMYARVIVARDVHRLHDVD